MADPLITDPMYVMNAMSMAALDRLIKNPYTDPDTTPPAEEVQSKMNLLETARASAARPQQQSPGDAPPLRLPPPSPAQEQEVSGYIEKQELTDEVKEALDVLKRDGIVEQVDEHWRFK